MSPMHTMAYERLSASRVPIEKELITKFEPVTDRLFENIVVFGPTPNIEVFGCGFDFQGVQHGDIKTERIDDSVRTNQVRKPCQITSVWELESFYNFSVESIRADVVMLVNSPKKLPDGK